MEKIKINVELIVKSLILNESLKNKHAGTTKILIINRLYANKPIGLRTCNISGNQDQV